MILTPAHRGGAGPPLVLLHGFLDTWRVWEPVLPALQRRHDVLALTLAGHGGGPPLPAEVGVDVLTDAVEAAMDDAGFATAHLAGNSLGGWIALVLATRGRARSVVGLAPAGGWADDDASWRALLRDQARTHAAMRASLPHAAALEATPEGRRILAAAACDAEPLIAAALREGYVLDPARITCPVRMVWGTDDLLLPWPSAAARFRERWLPHADWVLLDGVGHHPQVDAPLETAQLILGVTGALGPSAGGPRAAPH